MKLPLEGVRVIEVAHYVAIPAAGAMLADLGADVVKVEIPPRGEIMRRSRPRYMGYDCDFDESPSFQMENRGKRSIVLDLRDSAAQDALHRMLDRAEIFITNLLPARRLKYRLDHETLLARCPRLVMGAISGYGDGGKESDRPAFDYAAYWARTGMMDLMHDEGTAPSMQRPGLGDHAAAGYLLCGLLAAMRLRDATGIGRYVDVSLLQTGFYGLGNDVANALVTREPAQRHDRAQTLNPLWNSYPVQDGRWLLLVMIDPDRYWPGLCEAIGHPELRSDERFADGFARAANAAALIEILEATFRQRSLDVWRERLDTAGLIWAPVNRVEEAIQDPQARAMGYFTEIEHADQGRFETVGPPFRIEGVELPVTRAAPDLDADAEDVLREAGLGEDEIARLRENREASA